MTARVTPLDSRGHDRKGGDHLDYLEHEGGAYRYYQGKDGQLHDATQWCGAGAESLGLAGRIDFSIVRKLAAGFGPDGKAKLCQNAGKASHEVGADVTFSAPKAVSALYAKATVDEQREILRVQQAAAAAGIAFYQRSCTSRRGKQGHEEIGIQGMVAASFTHFDARPVEADPAVHTHALVLGNGKAVTIDPQLHTHTLLFNTVLCDDGVWRTFNTDQLMRLQMATGAIYRAELAKGLAELGYGIEKQVMVDADDRPTGDISFGVVGTTPEELAELSRRTEQINEYAESHGTDRLTAAKRSRNDKDCPPHDDLTKHWSDRLDDLRTRGALRYRHAKDMKGLPSNVGGASLDAITDQLEAHEVYFTRAAVIQRVALEYVGVMSAGDVEKAVDAQLASNRFVALDKTDDHGQALYTSQRQIDRELWMDAHSRAGVSNQAVRLNAEAVQAAIAEFTAKKGAPSLEQRAAIERVTMGTGTVAIIEGRAGTGKSYTSEAIKRAFELEGYTCLGAAIANAAQKKLEAESGMASSSITSLLARLDRGMPLPKRCAIFVDEIGMVDSRSWYRLKRHVAAAEKDGAVVKLIGLGDRNQLAPVGAGNPMQAEVKVVGRSLLTRIRRQRDREDRVTSSMFYGQNAQDIIGIEAIEAKLKTLPSGPSTERDRLERERERLDRKILGDAMAGGTIDAAAVFKRLCDRGQVAQAEDSVAAMHRLVDDYFDARATADIPDPHRPGAFLARAGELLPPSEKLILGSTRSDVAALNDAVRSGLKQRGLLRDGYAVKTIQSNGEYKVLELSKGDRIRFGAANTRLDVINGTTATIESIQSAKDGRGYDLVLREYSDIAKLHGRTIRLNTEDERHLSHAYAVTVHKSQGQGLAWVGALANARMLDKAAALVAFTRSKQAFRFYAGQMDFKGLAEAFARERLKRNAIDFATRAQRQRLDEKRQERDTTIAQQRSEIGEREAATAMSHRFVRATRALREAWRDRRDRHARERDERLLGVRTPLERLRVVAAHARRPFIDALDRWRGRWSVRTTVVPEASGRRDPLREAQIKRAHQPQRM
ncbi:hypothetical protein C0Z18_01995 [Trinickia dabaoshanensis]|uniref:TrwC relaxase domain-containing protein n=1 Tax=Trinickia dabaoshanensis TaxID=564714 RepID=A0A2N7W0S8_9BURK|nr:relaxase domain-containing protein [Trinickia dabaoshanensis]PMS23018.1 hypothetical protein C0Z18_01995 [Trinickia dabaoshanensis]